MMTKVSKHIVCFNSDENQVPRSFILACVFCQPYISFNFPVALINTGSSFSGESRLVDAFVDQKSLKPDVI